MVRLDKSKVRIDGLVIVCDADDVEIGCESNICEDAGNAGISICEIKDSARGFIEYDLYYDGTKDPNEVRDIFHAILERNLEVSDE